MRNKTDAMYWRVAGESKIQIEIPFGGERFTATGTMVGERNFLDVYPYVW